MKLTQLEKVSDISGFGGSSAPTIIAAAAAASVYKRKLLLEQYILSVSVFSFLESRHAPSFSLHATCMQAMQAEPIKFLEPRVVDIL